MVNLVSYYGLWAYDLIAQDSPPPADSGFIQEFFFGLFASIVDIMAFLLPQTPDDFKLGTLLTGFLAFQNENFANYFIIQAFSGLAGILLLIAIYKFIKILPFT